MYKHCRNSIYTIYKIKKKTTQGNTGIVAAKLAAKPLRGGYHRRSRSCGRSRRNLEIVAVMLAATPLRSGKHRQSRWLGGSRRDSWRRQSGCGNGSLPAGGRRSGGPGLGIRCSAAGASPGGEAAV